MPFKDSYVISSIVSCQLSLLLGAAQGFSGILLPQLRNSHHITREDISWIASLGLVCKPLGAIFEGYLVDKFGRKRTMQTTAFLFISSWAFTALASDIKYLCASRVFSSFTTGMVICVGMYIAEITKPEDRGTYLSLITPIINCGILLVYLLGYLLHWKVVASILITYSIIIFFILQKVPETHIWYMLKNKRNRAANILLTFRNDNVEAVNQELDQIKTKMSRYEEGKMSLLLNFFKPSVWKPFAIFVVFSFFQQQTGYNVIIHYGVTFFDNLGSDFKNSYLLSIIFATISILGSAILVLIVHKFNRITLLVVSGLGMSLAMGIGALSFTLSFLESYKWISVICTFMYIFFCMLGMIDIPWMMINEVFPNRMRGSMSAAIIVVIFFFSFINIKLYNAMDHYLGKGGVLWCFTVLSLITAIFAKIYLPETNGKALTEIEDNYYK